MDDLVLNVIPHIRNISKKKLNYKGILSCIQKSTARCSEVIENGIIDKDVTSLIPNSCESKAILDDSVDFVTSDESNLEIPQRVSTQN